VTARACSSLIRPSSNRRPATGEPQTHQVRPDRHPAPRRSGGGSRSGSSSNGGSSHPEKSTSSSIPEMLLEHVFEYSHFHPIQ